MGTLRVELDMAVERIKCIEEAKTLPHEVVSDARLPGMDVICDRLSHLEVKLESEREWREKIAHRLEQAVASLGHHGEDIQRFSQTLEARCVTDTTMQSELLCEGLDKLANFAS